MDFRHQLVKNIISKIDNGVFVEIGTYLGDFADFILENSNNSVLYCVDPYLSYNDYSDYINKVTGQELFIKTFNTLRNKYGDRVKFIRKFSKKAVDNIPNKIDFLYIDGNHSYKYVMEDLQLYYPKVKSGGYIVGDDAVDLDDNLRNADGDVLIHWSKELFGHYGVVKAFNEFIIANNISGQIQGNQYVIHKK